MHESVANAKPRNHERERVNELIPRHIRSASQRLVEFLKVYYDYLNQDGGPTNELRHIVAENDIDETSAKYLDAIKDEIATIVPESDVMDRNTLYKRVVEFYRSKGTKEAVLSYFRMFFNDVEDLEIIYGDKPYTYKIRSSLSPVSKWADSYKNLAHPAGMEFTAAVLVQAGVVGGGDITDSPRAGWDADYWKSQLGIGPDLPILEELYDSDEFADLWLYDLLPPNRRGAEANEDLDDSQFSLVPFTAYLLSKRVPPSNVTLRFVYDMKAGARWRTTAIDNQTGDDVTADLYDNYLSYDSNDNKFDITTAANDDLVDVPPSEIIETRAVDVLFNLVPFIADSRDTFVRERTRFGSKFFDPGSLAQYAGFTFEQLAEDYDKKTNVSELSNLGADVLVIPHRLFFGASDTHGVDEEGESTEVELLSNASVGNNKKFHFELINTSNIDSDDYFFSSDSDASGDSQGGGDQTFFIVRPERMPVNGGKYVQSDKFYCNSSDTTDFHPIYSANVSDHTVGVPVTIEETINFGTNFSALDHNGHAWAWGEIGAEGSIEELYIEFGGNQFNGVVANGYTGATATRVHAGDQEKYYRITFGTEWKSDSLYAVGDQMYYGDNLYQVTAVTGDAKSDASTPPTHTSSAVANDNITLQYKGDVARAVVTQFTEATTTAGIADIQFLTVGSTTGGSGYSTFLPDHDSGANPDGLGAGIAYDKSRFRVNNHDEHSQRWNSFWQNGFDGERDWSNDKSTSGDNSGITLASRGTALQFTHEVSQKTDGDRSYLLLEISADGASEPDGVLTIRSIDYPSLEDTLKVSGT